MGASILWAPGKIRSFCRKKTHVLKIPRFRGGYFGVLGGGGSADFIFMGARIFLMSFLGRLFVALRGYCLQISDCVWWARFADRRFLQLDDKRCWALAILMWLLLLWIFSAEQSAMHSQHPSTDVKKLWNFKTQIWLEIITSRDAKMLVLKAPRRHVQKYVFGFFRRNLAGKDHITWWMRAADAKQTSSLQCLDGRRLRIPLWKHL